MTLADYEKAVLLTIGTIVAVILLGLRFSAECNNIVNGFSNLYAIVGESIVYAGILLFGGSVVVGIFRQLGIESKDGSVVSNVWLFSVVLLIVGYFVSPAMVNYAQQAATEACITGISGPI